MAMPTPFPAATSSRLPEGVSVQPRTFAFHDLESLPQHWFADNPILTHLENAFSIMIPPGERFFIRAVRHFEDRVTDPELRTLVKAFVQQEGLHIRAHNEFNHSLGRFGIDVEREIAAAERVMDSMQRRLPHKVQLGVTVFLEHVTAIGAHMLFTEPAVAESMHPELARFWRWHAAEELEHKAVAFDVFRAVGGGYFLRIFSALAAVLLLTPPLVRMVRRMEKQDPREVTDEMRRSARELNGKLWRPQLRMLGQYFKPGFHPWNCDDEPYLKQWYASARDTT
jgi:hypothetical protein